MKHFAVHRKRRGRSQPRNRTALSQPQINPVGTAQQPSMHTQQQALINAPRENILQAKPPFELTGEHF
jgi:hypothetical protein